MRWVDILCTNYIYIYILESTVLKLFFSGRFLGLEGHGPKGPQSLTLTVPHFSIGIFQSHTDLKNCYGEYSDDSWSQYRISTMYPNINPNVKAVAFFCYHLVWAVYRVHGFSRFEWLLYGFVWTWGKHQNAQLKGKMMISQLNIWDLGYPMLRQTS